MPRQLVLDLRRYMVGDIFGERKKREVLIQNLPIAFPPISSVLARLIVGIELIAGRLPMAGVRPDRWRPFSVIERSE